jgi:hypothetical protein
MKVDDLIVGAQDLPAAFREWFSLMLRWEVEQDASGNIKDEYLNDGQGRTFAGLTSDSDGILLVGVPSVTYVVGIYYKKYWMPFSSLPKSVAQIVANYGLNMGKSEAIILLQNCLGNVVVDGILGDKTVRACWETDQHELCLKLIEEGRQHYEQIGQGSRARFLSGWLNRNNAVAQAFA